MIGFSEDGGLSTSTSVLLHKTHGKSGIINH